MLTLSLARHLVWLLLVLLETAKSDQYLPACMKTGTRRHDTLLSPASPMNAAVLQYF